MPSEETDKTKLAKCLQLLNLVDGHTGCGGAGGSSSYCFLGFYLFGNFLNQKMNFSLHGA